MTRKDGRAYDELRPIKITTDFVKFPEGSCLIECGDTKVLCCASIEDKTPPHVAEGEGWVTAEYSMLPRANRERSKRDIAKLKLSPRSAEIQRLVGRSLRAAVDMKALGERTINIDCDVLQGDGGTRTASVTGGFVALALACRKLVEEGYLGSTPIRHFVTGVSAGQPPARWGPTKTHVPPAANLPGRSAVCWDGCRWQARCASPSAMPSL